MDNSFNISFETSKEKSDFRGACKMYCNVLTAPFESLTAELSLSRHLEHTRLHFLKLKKYINTL